MTQPGSKVGGLTVPSGAARRSTAAELVSILHALVGALSGRTVGVDVDWLRPLAVLASEIEYEALHRTPTSHPVLAAECRELRGLLCGTGSREPGGLSLRNVVRFALRYDSVLQLSPAIAALHDRVLTLCRDLVDEKAS